MQGDGQVKGRHNDGIGGGFERHAGAGGEPCGRVRNTLGTGCPYPDSITSVMIQCRAEVPAINGMEGPCIPDTRFLTNQDTAAMWCQWGPIVVESAVQLGLG
jgi:hypothetical protein